MSLERGMQALNLQMPDVIPHQQYIHHLDYAEMLTGERNLDLIPKKLDYDFLWVTAVPETPKPGRWTDMGQAYWTEDQKEENSRHEAFASIDEAFELDVAETYGVWDLDELTKKYTEDALANTKDHFCVYPGGTYRTQMSFAIAAFGWDMLLMMAGLDVKRFTEILHDWLETLKVHYQALAASPYDCILTHDDIVWTAGAFMHPDWYRKELIPGFKEIWDIVHAAGKKVIFCSDANYQQFVPDIAEAGADGFVFDPMVDMEYMVKEFGKTHVLMGGVDCRIMTFGTEEETRAAVREALDLGRDCPGYFFSVSNQIPENIPIQNVVACMDEYFKLRDR